MRVAPRAAGNVVLVAIAAAAGAIAGRLAAPDPAPQAVAATVTATRPAVDRQRVMAALLEAPVREEASPPPPPPATPASAAPARRMPEVLDRRIAAAAPDPAFAAGAERTMHEALGGAGRLEEVRCGGNLCRFAVTHGDEDGAEAFHAGLGPRFLGAQLHVLREESADGRSRLTIYDVRPRT